RFCIQRVRYLEELPRAPNCRPHPILLGQPFDIPVTFDRSAIPCISLRKHDAEQKVVFEVFVGPFEVAKVVEVLWLGTWIPELPELLRGWVSPDVRLGRGRVVGSSPPHPHSLPADE